MALVWLGLYIVLFFILPPVIILNLKDKSKDNEDSRN